MTIARRVRWFLESRNVEYELLPHGHSSTSLESARAAHVPAERVAKCVLLEDEMGYLMAILPASCRIELPAIEAQTGRRLELAGELELQQLFTDCETGAIPPLGDAYNIRTLLDDELMTHSDIYFEAGDHEDLVHVAGAAFRELLSHSEHGRFSRPM